MTMQVCRAVVLVSSKCYIFALLSCVYFIEVTLHKSTQTVWNIMQSPMLGSSKSLHLLRKFKHLTPDLVNTFKLVQKKYMMEYSCFQ